MTQAEIIVLILNYAIKYGIDAAIAIAALLKNNNATIDDAIMALETAKLKTAQQYLDEAKLKAIADGTIPPIPVPPTPPA